MAGSKNKKRGAKVTKSSVQVKPENVEEKEMANRSTEAPLQSQALEVAWETSTEKANKQKRVKKEKQDVPENVKENEMVNPSAESPLQSQALAGVSEPNTKNANKRKRVKEEKQDVLSKQKIVEHQNSNEEKKADETGDKTDQGNQNSGKKFGGLIFLCNARTKPDCFHFGVMGITEDKKELVMDIKPGLKLFLYDTSQRMMHGVFEASSAGGMRLEPKAFGGGFSAQVRFKVHTECIPIPERVFKKAITDNYDEKTRRFKTELTYGQVKRLTVLFRDATRAHSNVKFAPHQLSLTEKEYRAHGLQSGRSSFPTPPSAHVFESPANAASGHEDRLYSSEKDYHHTIDSEPNQQPVYDPYDDTTASLVNRYLSMPPAAPPSSSYYPRTLPAEEPYTNNSGGLARDPLGRPPGEGSYYSSTGISSDHHHHHHQQQHYRRLDAEPKPPSSGVSSRYLFAGPPVLRR